MSGRKRPRKQNIDNSRNWPKETYLEKLKEMGIGVNATWKPPVNELQNSTNTNLNDQEVGLYHPSTLPVVNDTRIHTPGNTPNLNSEVLFRESATAFTSATDTLSNSAKLMLKTSNVTNKEATTPTLESAIRCSNSRQTDSAAEATSTGKVYYAEDLPKMDFVAPSIKKQIIEDLPKSSTSSRDSTHSVSEILASNVELNAKVKNLIHNSIASSTRSQYEHGFKSYKNFLCLSGFKWDDKTDMPPLTEDILMHYATHCHENLKIKCSTIKMYICGLRYIYLQSGVQCLFSSCCSSKLLSLYRRCFGFLRCGELTVNTDFDASCNLCIEDITFEEDYAILHLKTSKTDPFRSGVNIYLFKNNTSVCPVKSLIRYLDVRRSRFSIACNSSPLFVMENGEALTRTFFINHVRSILEIIGLNPSNYNGHSFRIGAATSVASKIEDHLIKILGRWSSECYTRYIHTPKSTIKQAQLALISD
ncbi:unnamed protein product [Mytilus edulis]|uniref:Tyr recombinase domain-containing protein n=1 Tax=Mytilus edulis TaxID=6550 RepID=A0A8S3RF58_MYTED|nr:unnamed protein product [Mytilus edulis]